MPEVTEKSLNLKTEDHCKIAATVFKPIKTETTKTLVIGSALGVPRYFYYKFARFLATNGFSVLTFDYRGIYESHLSDKSGSEINMEEWGRYDIEAALRYASEEMDTDRLFYLGHSCGGQLLGLAPTSTTIDRIIFIACQLGYWKLWPFPYRIGVYLTWQLITIMVPFFDYLPTRILGISSLNLPSGVAKQWAEWGKSPEYLFNKKHRIDTSLYDKIEVPILSFHFTDDRLLAPAKSVNALLDKYSNAPVEKRNIDPANLDQESIGHFGFFKERLKDPLWQIAMEWFNQKDDH